MQRALTPQVGVRGLCGWGGVNLLVSAGAGAASVHMHGTRMLASTRACWACSCACPTCMADAPQLVRCRLVVALQGAEQPATAS